jgi:hypothetical protein
MPVAVDPGYAERVWTGVETDFAPSMVALAAAHVAVRYRSAAGVLSDLTVGAHLSVAKAGAVDVVGAISSAPIAMPPAPGTVIFERTTPASNDADFDNLEGYEPNVHTRLADAAALRDAELLGRQARAITPFTATDDVVDFRPRRVQGAEPVADEDFATKLWVLTITGILDLTALVVAAATSAASAAASLAASLIARTGAEAARDKAELWSEQTEDTEVEAGKYSALHWAAKANAAAAIILPYLTTSDDGLFGDVDTGNIDDGVFP